MATFKTDSMSSTIGTRISGLQSSIASPTRRNREQHLDGFLVTNFGSPQSQMKVEEMEKETCGRPIRRGLETHAELRDRPYRRGLETRAEQNRHNSENSMTSFVHFSTVIQSLR